jgi:hypothetical protein
MSIADRRQAVKELAAEGESTRGIAEVLGTSKSTVADDLAVQNWTHYEEGARGGRARAESCAKYASGRPLRAPRRRALHPEVASPPQGRPSCAVLAPFAGVWGRGMGGLGLGPGLGVVPGPIAGGDGPGDGGSAAPESV